MTGPAMEPPFNARDWPSEKARACVGQRVHYTGNKPDRDIDGTVVDAEWTASTVTTEHGTFPGVRFKIKPLDGRRAFWTHAMPDTGNGV